VLVTLETLERKRNMDENDCDLCIYTEDGNGQYVLQHAPIEEVMEFADLCMRIKRVHSLVIISKDFLMLEWSRNDGIILPKERINVG